MLWIQDYNGDQAPITAYQIQVIETLGSFDALSFVFCVDPNDEADTNYVASNMIIPKSIVTEPKTGKKFRVLQPTCVSVGNMLQYTVTCTSVAYDLHAKYVESTLTGTQALTACFDLITSGTLFSYHITGSFANYEFSETFGGGYADDLLNSLANDFGFEFCFDNYDIYIKPTIGTSGAFLFVDNQNASGIQRQEDYSTLTTHIKGYGKENNSTDDSDSSTTTYSTTAEYTSPAESAYGLIDAEPYSSDSITDQATLLAKLKEEIHDYPDVQYTMSYTDFVNNAKGFTNDFTSGNYGWLRDRFGTDISVRVQSVSWYPQEQDSAETGSITLGNKIFDPNIYINKMRKAYEENYALGQSLAKSVSSISSSLNSTSKTLNTVSSSAETLANEVTTLQRKIQDLQNSNGTWASGNLFVDLSSNNGATSTTDQASSWYTSLYNNNVKGAIIKLTQGSDSGTNYTSPIFDSQKSNVISAGMKYIGAYHYFTATSVSDATAEATHFLEQLQSRSIDKSTIVACDVEDSGLSKDEATLTSELAAFFKVLTDAGYIKACIYASESWFTGARFTFADTGAVYRWVAAWGSTKPDTCDAWQYADTFNGQSLDINKSYSQAFV